MSKVKLALIQMKMSSDREKNTANAISKIYKAKKKVQILFACLNYF